MIVLFYSEKMMLLRGDPVILHTPMNKANVQYSSDTILMKTRDTPSCEFNPLPLPCMDIL
jgi:hypothetical protein